MSRTPIPPAMANEVILRWGSDCLCCGVATLPKHDGSDRSLEMDHVVPEAWGGPTVPLNLQPLCRACNATKADGWSFDHRSWDTDEEYEAVQALATRRPQQETVCGMPMLLTGDRCVCDAIRRGRELERTMAVIV
jgi:5-methylcytosine-specific restriction endonuclease McrA